MDEQYLIPLKTTPSKVATHTHVTVTHPHHPLTGLRLEIVKTPRKSASSLIVRVSDRTLRLPKEWTDYYGLPDQVSADPLHLCSLEGLKQLARMLEATAIPEISTNIAAINNKRKVPRRVKTD